MKIDEMKLLVRVAETGSMTVAARQLYLTPAAVSAAVRRIEEAVGVRLFERTTRSLHPTDEGLVVLDSCHDIVERWQQTVEDVHEASHRLAGTIHVSAPSDTVVQLIGPLVAEMSEQHPDLQIVVHSSDAVQHLHRDAIDVAIRYGPLQDSALTARRLVDGVGWLVASPEYLDHAGRPQVPGDLALHRCITFQLSTGPRTTWQLHDGASSQEVEVPTPLCGDGYLVRRWAIDGHGIALKALFDVVDDLEAGRLVRVLPHYDTGPAPIHAVFPSRRYLPARVRAFAAKVEESCRTRAERCDTWR